MDPKIFSPRYACQCDFWFEGNFNLKFFTLQTIKEALAHEPEARPTAENMMLGFDMQTYLKDEGFEEQIYFLPDEYYLNKII